MTAKEVLLRRRFAIINGDDFGFSHGVNCGIIQAHELGVLTSTSLMVTGDAFAEAVTLAQAHPNLAVGLHLVLVNGRAVLPPEEISHLVDSKGNFPFSPLKTGLLYQFNQEARAELRREIRAQLEKFRQTGLKLAHVDSHLHLHSHPIVLQTIVELAEEFEIKIIRIPREELIFTLQLDRQDILTKLLRWVVFTGLSKYGKKLLKSKNIQCADRVYGLLQTGQINEDYLLGLIPKIEADLIELYSHPAIAIPEEPINGPPGAGEVELHALLSKKVKEAIDKNGFTLINYNNGEGKRSQ